MLPPPYQIDTMNEIEEQGIEIEAPTTFSGAALADEDTVQVYDEEDNEQHDDESMNDESVNNETSYIKWLVIAMASFAVFLGIGLGSGYGIGNEIWGNDNESSVSSAMAVDFTTSDHGGGGGKSGKSEGPSGSKSAKSAGVSTLYYYHCAHVCSDMNQLFFLLLCWLLHVFINLPHIVS